MTIEHIQGNGLYRITYADKKPGPIPEKYSGSYTKVEYVQADIVNFVREAWQNSEVK